MAHKAEQINNYNFQSSDKLLLDANIWLLIYGPQKADDFRVKTYSSALSKMLKANCQIYIDVLILSEFINRYTRIKHQLSGDLNNFKIFRKSKAFKLVAAEISDIVKRILKSSCRIESGIEQLDISNLVTKFENGDADFNDLVISSLCKNKHLKLVTDDSDFDGAGLHLLTANKRLLT